MYDENSHLTQLVKEVTLTFALVNRMISHLIHKFRVMAVITTARAKNEAFVLNIIVKHAW